MTLDDCFLRAARCYLPDSDTNLFADHNTFDAGTYEKAGFNIEGIFKFCKKVKWIDLMFNQSISELRSSGSG